MFKNVHPTKVSLQKLQIWIFVFQLKFFSSFAGRRAVSGSRERYSDRYGYGRQGGTGPRHSGGHTPNSEEPSTVTRKKTPLHLLHQRVGVSVYVYVLCVIFMCCMTIYVQVYACMHVDIYI